jgi:hypothetical protein
MEELQPMIYHALEYRDAEAKGIMSTRRTVEIRPTTGTSVNSASTSDIVQFKLPNTGVLMNCYLKYTITGAVTAGTDNPSGNTFDANNLVCDPYAPSAACIRRFIVTSSDGTELTNVQNYNHWCSLLARYGNTKEWSESYGANQEGCPERVEYSDLEAVVDGTTTNIHSDAEMNAKRLKRNWAGSNTVIHKFQAGILDQKKEICLPLAMLGSGMNVYLHLADKDEVFRATPNQAGVGGAGSALDCHVAADAAVASYSLSNLSLVCDLVFLPPSITASIQEKLCNGLKIRCDRIRSQTNAVTQESNVVILNEHARSVSSVIGYVKNSSEKSNGRRDENSYYRKPGGSSGSAVKEVQLQVGAENVPTNPCEYGAQSWIELEKAMKSVFDESFKMGNQISRDAYNAEYPADTAAAGSGGGRATPGSAAFGFNLKNFPEMPEVMSGKSSSSGSIPISLTLNFDGSTSLGNAELETFTVSDSVVEFLADGSALVHK